MVKDEAWFFEHAVECPVTGNFAWRFWTDVNNWRLDADVESVELDGSFAAGSRGATISRSGGRVEWRIASVEADKSAVIEATVAAAVLRSRWTFEESGDRTRITQRMSLAGIGAEALVNAVATAFESNIPAGMQKLCETMEHAQAAATGT
jgi:hypothetical protein